MTTGTAYTCSHCYRPVEWGEHVDNWAHLDGERSCGPGRSTRAAVGSFVRCKVSRRIDDGRATCARPDDGHRDHVARERRFRSDGMEMSAPLLPPLRWTGSDPVIDTPAEAEPLADLLGEVLDLTDQVVDRVTDDEVGERLEQLYATLGTPAEDEGPSYAEIVAR